MPLRISALGKTVLFERNGRDLGVSRAVQSDSILETLIRLFFRRPSDLGHFRKQLPQHCPEVYRKLLAHTAHMTVTVEQHHSDRVDVEVLNQSWTGDYYQRKILLRRQGDGRVVQFGIVRMSLKSLPLAIHSQVISGQIPLGRLLIESGVLREVQLCNLWRVQCGAELANVFGAREGQVTYGRTARIIVDSVSAIELLEIVAPEPHRRISE